MEVKTSFKVEEGTVQETLMMPLYGRVYCEEHFPNTFPNKAAKETAAKVDYDFSKVKSSELNMSRSIGLSRSRRSGCQSGTVLKNRI